MFNLQKITDKIAAGKVPVGSHVGFDSPFLTEALAGCGFDFIWIDAEHSAIDKKISKTICSHAAQQVWPVSSVSRGTIMFLSKAFSTWVQTVSSCRWCARWRRLETAAAATHYPPNGVRGMGNAVRSSYSMWDKAEYTANEDKHIWTIVQIEHVDVVRIWRLSRHCLGIWLCHRPERLCHEHEHAGAPLYSRFPEPSLNLTGSVKSCT